MKRFLLMLILAACSSRPVKGPNETPQKKTPTVSIESKQLASEEESNLVTEVTFPKQKAEVGPEARASLKKLAMKAKSKGKISEIKVITWADQEYPSKQEEDLSQAQKSLVERRNKAITKYLDQLDKNAKVKTYSMAERPGAIEKMFSSEGADIKKSLEGAGIPTTETAAKMPGKASKSVVIFLMDEG